MIIDDKLMKYVIFKKRTEKEVRQKCEKLEYTSEYIEEIIDYLTQNAYIDDKKYVEKYIQNIMRLKKASIFEIKMDLIKRGVLEDYIDEYINNNRDELEEFERESAIKLMNKKINGSETEKVKRYLLSKGYSYGSIANAIDNLGELQDNN
ncbi:MAG: RecX family transcriptional regulator [Clostridia bacterium]|nr:RecX family transcriptional regulator [Clostridia bacterium]